MTYCPKCGSENEPSAKFCLKCGQELAATAGARDVSKGRGKAKVVLLVLLSFVGLALLGVCAVGGVALFQKYREELRVRHYTQGIQAVDTREWDLAVSELQQAGDYLDAEEKLEYAEAQLGRLLVLYERGMTHFDAGEYWDAAWWLGQAADMHPDYKDANESLEYARQQTGKILYVVIDSQGQHVHIMDADGRNQRQVMTVGPQEGDLLLVGVSGDATRILFLTYLFDSTLGRSFVDLYSLDLVSGEATRLENDADAASGSISPNGDQVIIQVTQEPGSEHSLYLADFDGRNRRVLATASRLLVGRFGSSDGERILVSRNNADPEGCVIYWTDPTGQQYDQVMEREGVVCYGYFSRDLRQMFLVVEPEEGYALYTADSSGLRITEVMSSDTDVLRVAPWSAADGESFVFAIWSSRDSPNSYFLATAAGSRVRALPFETGGWPELSPTLEHALDVSHGEATGENRLYVVETNTGDRILLSNSLGELAGYQRQSFSPDGHKVMYPEKNSEGQTAIYVANLDGSERQLVAYGDRPVWLWRRQ